MKHCTQGFVILNFLLVQTPELRDSQIYENGQLWYSMSYSNFLQVFTHISEIHIIGKIFTKYMDPVTSTVADKKFSCHMLLS